MPVQVPSFPTSVATFTDKFDLIDVVFADQINSLQREVTAIESVLGTLPAGTAASVRDRIAAIESSVTDINNRFTATKTVPQTTVDGLGTSLNNLQGQISNLSALLNTVQAQVSSVSANKTDPSQVVLLTGAQYIYGLKQFQALVRMLATQLYSASSTNHAWEIGVAGGRVIKFDYTGLGAYDGNGPAEIVMQRDGGEMYFGGGVRAAGMVGVSVDYAGPLTVTSETYATVTGTPALSLKVPQSGRVMVSLTDEASVSTGEARMSVRLSGGNTLAESDVRSVVVASPNLHSAARLLYLTGLTPGSTTFTTVFRSSLGASAHFSNITLAVVPVL